ncbi:MAG: VOC family protein [Candidatus Eremiobacteraeota bacterium]|nr:VOC family protein [Candidatus Eremiobacteraeota bacterium]
MIKEIAFTVYPAKDVKKLADFYAGVLGLNLTNKFEEDGKLQYAEFTVGKDGYFGVMPSEWMDREPGSASGIGFEVEDIEAWLKTLESKGVKIEKPYDTPVCRISSILDPEGNKVTFHQTTVAH